MDIYDFANKVYEESKLEEAFSLVDYIISHAEVMYPKTRELCRSLDNYPHPYECEKDGVRASTTWWVDSTLHEFMEEPFTGRTAFVVWDVSPDWAITWHHKVHDRTSECTAWTPFASGQRHVKPDPVKELLEEFCKEFGKRELTDSYGVVSYSEIVDEYTAKIREAVSES